MALLECRELSKSYGSLQVLDHITLQLQPGRIVGLLGPNGQGKSTLMKAITGLIRPDAGTILLDGQPLGVSSPLDIAYLPEKSYLDTTWTIQQVLDLFAAFYSNFDSEKALRMLEDLNLDPGARIKTLSKGTQEKLLLVLVMARNAKLYILDEPLGGVDPAARDTILDTILTHFAEGSSVLISTHLISDIERILDDVLFIRGGQIIVDEEADVLRAQHHASIDALFRRRFKCS